MAYTAVVTKGTVSKTKKDSYNIVVNVKVNDGTSDIFDQNFNVRYNSNAANMDDIQNSLVNDIKEAWDEYAAENNIFNAPVFDSLVGDLQTQSNIYMNL